MNTQTTLSALALVALTACAPQFNEASNEAPSSFDAKYFSGIGHTVNAEPFTTQNDRQAVLVTVHDENTASMKDDLHPVDLEGTIYVCGSNTDDKQGLTAKAAQFFVHLNQETREDVQNFFDTRAETICGLTATLE